MAIHVISTSNWNDPAFWSAISLSTNDTFDFSGLDGTYSVEYLDDNKITINQGATSFVVGDSGYSGSSDASIGAGSFTSLDSIIGTQGQDVLYSSTDIELDGGSGDDTFVLNDGFGNATITGGEDTGDDDTLDLSSLSSGVDVRLAFSSEQGYVTDGTDTANFDDIETFILTDEADSFASNGITGEETIYAGGGDDTINTQAGADYVDGGSGNDSIVTGQGDDIIYGGDGNDFIDSQSQNDTIYAGAGDDTVSAGQHDDYVEGGDGNDWILGQGGEDTLYGQEGNDTLYGHSENDHLDGGSGDDQLIGGHGDDTFVYTSGHDTITDFNAGNTGTLDDGDSSNNDFIDLSDYYDDIWELHADQADDGVLNQSNDGTTGVDYSDNTQFGANDSLTFTGASADGSFFTNENTGVVCFVKGTAILTKRGEVPVEDLRPGDRVQTYDNGYQTLLWIGQRQILAPALWNNPNLRPMHIREGQFGANRDLFVSQQHAVALGDVLVRAKHLADVPDMNVSRVDGSRRVVYFHLFFARHEIIFANGVPAESLYPGPQALSMLTPISRCQLQCFAPRLDMTDPLGSYGPTARPILKRKDVDRWSRSCSLSPSYA